MKIKILADYRGWITKERYYKAGDHDIATEVAMILVKHKRAVEVETGSKQAALPTDTQRRMIDVPNTPPDLSPSRKYTATKSARALAEKHNLLLYSVVGTGKKGKIILSDVQGLIKDG